MKPQLPVGLDPYVQALVRTKVRIDSASRVFFGDSELQVFNVNGVRKVQLPNTQFLIRIDDLVAHGAEVLGGRTPDSLALRGSQARWSDRRTERESAGLPPNVYLGNAHSIKRALDKGEAPPPHRYIGRRQSKMTEVYDTVEEVVAAMNNGEWRTEFSRGRYAKRGRR